MTGVVAADVTPAETLIPGIEFPFGRITLLVPPISFGALERMRERINAIPNLQATDPVAQAAIVDSLHAALKRNYPHMTRGFVAEELVDVGNMFDAYACVMDIGGMMRKHQAEEREAATSGNDQATGPTTGAGSSPA